ncbi:hypothetical protein GCM10007242_20940 [Pigmentiphaga litoralis]|nr:hypothetical protein GCM10007242_20940 [Pigmentiphaga litoralis]
MLYSGVGALEAAMKAIRMLASSTTEPVEPRRARLAAGPAVGLPVAWEGEGSGARGDMTTIK